MFELKTSTVPLSTNWRDWPPEAKQLLLQRLRAKTRTASIVLTLREFIREAWHVVEPATVFVPGWHLDAIAEHLEAVTAGQIRNLIINIPPRHMKSLTVSVFWPTWVWTKRPETRWLFASYAEKLAIRDSLKCRRLILSPWYQRNWGDLYQLTNDQNQRTRFDNDRTGYRVATSVGGMGTGEGGDFIVVDDPHKAQEADSDAIRESVLEWWDQTMSTRGNDPKRVAKVIVMQRLHEEDLTGHVLKKMHDGGEHYEHLCLPAEYEGNRVVTVLKPEGADPRTQPGELLWPEHFGRAELETLKSNLNEAAAGQLQQRPSRLGGSIFRAEWWDIESGRNRYDPDNVSLARTCVGRWLFFDTAFKDSDANDYTAWHVAELTPEYRLLVRTIWQERILSAFLPERIEQEARQANRDDKLKQVVIEDKASGITAIQSLRATAPGWLANRIVEFPPNGTKEYRARQASIWCARDCVLMPMPAASAPWHFDFLDPTYGQLFQFPKAAHDDMVDTLVMGILYLENYLAAGWQKRSGYVAG